MADPSAHGACADCHTEIAAAAAGGLHATLQGMKHAVTSRGDCAYEGDVAAGFEATCAGCHATCGQCHVSRPNSVAGGFVSAHKFRPTPHMTDQCTACHGSRIGIDYLGEVGGGLEGNAPDYHRTIGYQCVDCHAIGDDPTEIHGDGGDYNNRYEVATMPRCEDCHADDEEANGFHNMHWGDLQCQVCHSQPYKNCSNCHSEPGSSPNYTIDASVAKFKIALNPRSDLRDYDYTVVRHVPVAHDTYEEWGLSPLPAYDGEPTWKYASPHNILRWTAQTDTTGLAAGTATCATACHESGDGTDSFFLREADLYNAQGQPLPDYDANLPYVIPAGSPAPTRRGDDGGN